MSRYSSIQKYNPFEIKVDTSIAGASGVGNFQLIINGNKTYRYYVEWGDGVTSASTSTTSLTHTYPSSGVYTVKAYGRLDDIYFNNSTEADKILDIISWGNVKWKTLYRGVMGSANLTGVTSNIFQTVSRVPDAGSIGFATNLFYNCSKMNSNLDSYVWTTFDLRETFRGCTLFNNGGSPGISGWTTSTCTRMDGTFRDATSFNQPIGSWDMGNVTTTSAMFYNADSFNQDIGSWDMSNVNTMSGMFNLNSGFNNGGSPSISGWTTSACTTMSQMFNGGTFNQPIGSWDVSNVNSMNQMFQNNGVFNNGGSPNISGWTTSACTIMTGMFDGTPFNQPIGNWDTSNVVSIDSMFFDATSFNQDIGSWNVGNVMGMNNMFRNSTSFNNGGSPSISGWTTSACTRMDYMFYNADTFNQPIGPWDTSNVTLMTGMFWLNGGFNQDIGSWDVSGVQNMGSMFNASVFNNGGLPSISGWTTSACTDMSFMFNNSPAFNQDIGPWDVSSVQNFYSFLSSTIGGSTWNGSVGGWDVSGANNMGFMFRGRSFFNQDLSSWNVGNVTDMNGMLVNCSSFNQDLGSWNVTGVTNMSSMLNSTAISEVNYNALLVGWTGWDGAGGVPTKTLKPNVTFGCSNCVYTLGTDAEAARNYLITGLTWTITDSGGV